MTVKIEDIMVTEVKTLETDASIQDVVEKMYKNEIGSVVILKDGNPFGIVTERDIVQKIVVKNKDPSTLKAKDIMSTPLETGNKQMTLLEAIKILVLNRIKKLPIIDNQGELVGIISLFDLVRWTPLVQQMDLDSKED
ncbi:MAG: CBS domain-containing protein [Candidatus Lokiarchaeota archaeon]|nr:CBS domain-containing protein [Candidatus Lokiarchaeota archaeon]